MFVAFNADAEDAPKDEGDRAASTLCSKLNKWMRSLNQEANVVANTLSHLVKSVQFSKCSRLLIECNSNTTAIWIRMYCAEKNLLSRISTTAKLQPCTYWLVLKFIPYNGSFDPDDPDQLRALELLHGLAEGSISSTTWIKKLELHVPNQKFANVKILFLPPHHQPTSTQKSICCQY